MMSVAIGSVATERDVGEITPTSCTYYKLIPSICYNEYTNEFDDFSIGFYNK